MAEYIQDKDIPALYDEHEPRYANSRREQRASRDFLAGRLKAPLDASILPGDTDREALRYSSPQKLWLPQKILGMLNEDTPEIKREPVGIGPRAQSVASRIEMIDNALAGLKYPDDVVNDLLLNEGAAIVVTMPAMAAWDGVPTEMYEDEERTTIKRAYAVDGKGRGEDDGYYSEPGSRRRFKPDVSKSASYFSSVEKDYRARNVPIDVKAMSCLEAVVINPRRQGDRMVLDGLIRRSEWSVSTLLQRGYRWGTSDSLEPAGVNSSSGTKMATMYEYWGTTASGHVYTSYCIEGLTTTKDGHAAVIDLTEVYGIQQLPVAFDYGLSFPGAISPDDRPLPFPIIFGRAQLAKDTAMTSAQVRFFKEANIYRGYKPDEALLRYLGIGKGDVPMPNMEPGKIIPILGDMMDMNSSGGLRELAAYMDMLDRDVRPELPSPDATGGGENVSGYGRNVAKRDTLANFQGVIRGALNLKAQSLAHANEQMACIGRKHRPICLYVNQDVPVEQRNPTEQSSTKAIIEVDPDVFGGVWDVHAVIPTDVGDNMPLTQQLADLHDRKKIPLEMFLEKGLGVKAPDVMLAKIKAEEAANSPLGQARLMGRAAELAADKELAAIMKGLEEQALVQLFPGQPAGPGNVVPTSIAAGVTPPHMTGMGGGAVNPAEQALAGIVSGGMQAGPMMQEGMVEAGGPPI